MSAHIEWESSRGFTLVEQGRQLGILGFALDKGRGCSERWRDWPPSISCLLSLSVR